jgi:hypothetical protein
MPARPVRAGDPERRGRDPGTRDRARDDDLGLPQRGGSARSGGARRGAPRLRADRKGLIGFRASGLLGRVR